MVHFEGDRFIPQQSSEAVSARLSDASFLVSCLNDVEIRSASPTRAEWKMKPGFSFIRTTLDTALEVIENTPGQTTRFRLNSSGIGATSTVEVALAYTPRDGGTAIHWTGDITQLTGLLKVVPRGLIQSAAGKVIEETWTAIEAKLSA